MKVRLIGGREDGNAVVEKGLDPRCVRPAAASLPGLPTAGDEVVLCDRGGHLRRARVVEVHGPLWQATCARKSGRWRSGWFDLLALKPPEAAR